MIKLRIISGLLILTSAFALRAADIPTAPAPGQIVLTFNKEEIGKPIPAYTQKGVLFALASPPKTSRAQGRIMFFPHLDTEKTGILNAMASEQAIPVRITFPDRASSVTLVLWGSIGAAAQVDAYDQDGKLVDTAKLAAVPDRKSPADPVPSFELTVKGGISYIQFFGAPNGGCLVADEVRFTPLAPASGK